MNLGLIRLLLPVFYTDTPYMINMSMCKVEQESDPKFKIAKETTAGQMVNDS